MPFAHPWRALIGATVAAAALTLGTATAVTAIPAEPVVTPASVQAAFNKATVANDKVNALLEKQREAEKAAKKINARIEDTKERFDEQREILGDAIVAQHMDAPLGLTAELFASQDPTAFLQSLRTIDTVNSARTDQMVSYQHAKFEYEREAALLKGYEKELQESLEDLEAERDELQRAHRQARAQLAQLTASQQASFNGATSGNWNVTATGNARKAIDFALAQVGDPYRYGATGPNAWDCSGLVQAAWRAGGVGLPRTSGAQMGAGKRIPISQVKPGDIVGFSASGGHNGLYIGGGKVVHAPSSGKSVSVVSVSMFKVATRVG